MSKKSPEDSSAASRLRPRVLKEHPPPKIMAIAEPEPKKNEVAVTRGGKRKELASSSTRRVKTYDSVCLEKNDTNSLATGNSISKSEQIDNGLQVKRKRCTSDTFAEPVPGPSNRCTSIVKVPVTSTTRQNYVAKPFVKINARSSTVRPEKPSILNLSSEIRRYHLWGLQQFARMQEEIVEERRKIRLLEKLATSLNNFDLLQDD